MNKKNLWKKIFSGFSVLALTGCVYLPSGADVSDRNAPQALESSAFVFSFGVNRWGTNLTPPNIVLFYNAEKDEWTRYKGKGSDESAIAYDREEKTLYFFDHSTDYILTQKNLEKVKHDGKDPKIISHAFVVEKDGQKSVLSSKNGGFKEDGSGYDWTFALSSTGHRESWPHHQYVQSIAQCEDGSVWYALSASAHTPEIPDAAPHTKEPLYIYKIYPQVDGGQHGKIQLDTPAIPEFSSITCANGKLYTIMDTYREGVDVELGGGPEDFSGSVLVSYDTNNGDSTYTPISGDLSTRISEENLNPDYGFLGYYRDGLWWLNESGAIVRTDVNTANNETVFTDEITKETGQAGFYEIYENYIFVFDILDDKMKVTRYNLDTRVKESEKFISGVYPLLGPRNFPMDIEITNLDALLSL